MHSLLYLFIHKDQTECINTIIAFTLGVVCSLKHIDKRLEIYVCPRCNQSLL